jgi:hypothetical protein
MTKTLLSALVMIVSSSPAFAAHTALDCAFKIGPMPYLNTRLDVTGPDQFGPTLTLLSVSGTETASISAEKVSTVSSDEQDRFTLDATDSSAFSTLIIYKADSSGISPAKLLMSPNAVSDELDGTCQYN